MTKWFETYRGVVNPWECDVVEHFTIAYYFDRFADATRNFFDLIGESDSLDAGVRPSRSQATCQHELRAGTGFHMLTAVTGIDAGALQLGHQVVDSTTSKTVTWLTERRALTRLRSPRPGRSSASAAFFSRIDTDNMNQFKPIGRAA